MSTENNIQSFLDGSPHAVVGASNDRSKFGNKVLRHYKQAGRTVYPVNPNEEEVEGLKCYPDLASLPATVHGISIITPPRVSEQIIEQAAQLGIKNVWLQPGAENQRVQDRATELEMNLISGGPCILMTQI